MGTLGRLHDVAQAGIWAPPVQIGVQDKALIVWRSGQRDRDCEICTQSERQNDIDRETKIERQRHEPLHRTVSSANQVSLGVTPCSLLPPPHPTE